jgi:hypothetical protein
LLSPNTLSIKRITKSGTPFDLISTNRTMKQKKKGSSLLRSGIQNKATAGGGSMRTCRHHHPYERRDTSGHGLRLATATGIIDYAI